ncbi:MAG: PAS domain S-box protein [Pseudomonadota bacterium]
MIDPQHPDSAGPRASAANDPASRPGQPSPGHGDQFPPCLERQVLELLHNISDGFVSLDRGLKVTFFNRAAERLLGRQARDVVGRHILEVFPEARGSLLEEKYNQALREGRALRFEAWFEAQPYRNWYAVHIYPNEHGVSVFFQVTTEQHAAQAQLDRFFELSSDLLCIAGLDGYFRRVNPAFTRTLGFSPQELLARPFLDLVHPQDRPATLIEMERLAKGQSVLHFNNRYQTKDGGWRWLSWVSSPSPEQGLIFAVARDVTDQKQSQLELQESERHYRQLFREMSSGLALHEIICDDQGQPVDYRFLDANPAFQRLTGLRLDDIRGKTVRQIMPGTEDIWVRRYGRVALGGQPEAFESFSRELGKHFEVKAFSPKPGQFAVLFQDVSPRVQAQEELKRQRDRLRTLMDIAGVMILALDDQGRVILANKKCCQVLGCSENQILGRDWFDEFLPARARGEVREVFRKLVGGGMAMTEFHENPVLRQDGGERLIAWHNAYFRDGDDRILGVLSSGEDITERRREEDERQRLDGQIQHAQKLESLGVLAGGIAHDFNNLLVSMLGNAELALLDLPPESPVRGRLTDLREIAIRASELSAQMLAYSGKGRFLVESLNLNRLVDEMAHLLRVSIAKNVVLKYSFHPDLPLVQADPSQLRQVIMNLIINASEAIGERSGVVTLSTGVTQVDHRYLRDTFVNDELPEGFYVYVEVSDTGCGMDPQTRLRIFDPFYTTKFTGRGLGLSAVLGIVRGHRGAIKVYSEPGRGTSFKVLLPCSQEQNGLETVEPFPESQASTTGGLVLVVDDEESVRTMTQMMLERSGYQAITAADGREGVELFKQRHGELAAVILDMTMPHMNGEEAFGEMRRLAPSVPVILASGYNQQDATNRFSGKGLAGFLQKPFRLKELREKMAQALGQRED